MKALTRVAMISGLLVFSQLAFAVTDTGTGQAQGTENSFALWSWFLSLMPF